MLHAPFFRHRGHLGEGHEAAHAVPVHHKAALVVLDDARREFGVFILQVNEIFPDLLFLGLVVGENGHSAGAAVVDMDDHHAGSGLHLLPLFRGQRPHFLGRNDAFGLEAGADDHSLFVNAHDFPGHQIASPVLPRGERVLREFRHIGDCVGVLGYHQLVAPCSCWRQDCRGRQRPRSPAPPARSRLTYNPPA